jgi:predicted Zn-dependent protease
MTSAERETGNAERGAVDAIERALRFAQGDEADAVVFLSDGNLTRFANSSVHQNLAERSGSLTIRIVADGGKIGVASTSALDDDGVRRCAALALELARRSEPAEGFAGLSRDTSPSPAVASLDEETASLDLSAKTRALKAMFDEGARAGVAFAGNFSTGVTAAAAGNSHGVRHEARYTTADALVIALGGRHSGYATRCSRRVSGVDVLALGREATEKATLLAGTEETLSPGDYAVILEPAALAEAFEWMNMISLSGQSYEDGSSFFVGKIGERVLGENVTLTDDAIDPEFMPFPFDMEGLPKRTFALVERGVVRTPALDTVAAARLGLAPTASAVSLESAEHGMAMHLAMAAGDSTLEEMIASTELGIWVTRFNYVNGLLDPKTALMTGMTRDGTFLVRDGRVAARLPNLRWTQSMVAALSNVESLSRERRAIATWWNPVGATIAPTIKVRKWGITGVQG